MKNTLRKLSIVGVIFVGVFFVHSNAYAAGVFHQLAGGADRSSGTWICSNPLPGSGYVRIDASSGADIGTIETIIAGGAGSGFIDPRNVCDPSFTYVNSTWSTSTPYLLITVATDPVNGDWYYWLMNTVTGLQAFTSEASTSVPFDANFGNATSSLTANFNFLQFLNVPTLLQTKVPFAYIFQIAEGIREGASSTNSTAIPSGRFLWAGIGGATSSIDMFSTTTIGYYLSPTLINLWRGFLLVVLYVEFGYALYIRAKSKNLL